MLRREASESRGESRGGESRVSASTSALAPPACSFDPSELAPMSEWRELSNGGYSEVYKAKLLGMTVAVKAATGRKKTSGESLLREIRYLRLCGSHPNIVQPYGAFVEGGRFHLVLEFARHCLRTDRVARQCDPILVMAGVARALVRIHSLGIIHRDLKSRNVLVAAENRALLIDFGLACDVECDPEDWLTRMVGTKKYRPPEMRDGRPANGAMDVYCYGLMLEKLVRQRRDRTALDDSHGRLRDAEVGRHERHDCRLLVDLAKQCTSERPHERPTAWALLQRLQRHAGESVGRCDAVRERVPLHETLHAGRERERSASLSVKQSLSGADEQLHVRKRRRLDSSAADACAQQADSAEADKEGD